MIDAATVAVGALVPYLAEAGKAAAGEIGKSTWAGIGKLWTLLRARLGKPEQQAALAELEASPRDADVQAAARVQLRKALAADASLAEELAALLESLPESVKQEIGKIVGDNNTAVQAVGSNVTIGG
jgi:hypothetical protein